MDFTKDDAARIGERVFKSYLDKEKYAEIMQHKIKAMEERLDRLYSMSHAIEARTEGLVANLKIVESAYKLAQTQVRMILDTLQQFDIRRYEEVVSQIELANALRKKHVKQTWMAKNGQGTKTNRRGHAADKFPSGGISEHFTATYEAHRGAFRWN